MVPMLTVDGNEDNLSQKCVQQPPGHPKADVLPQEPHVRQGEMTAPGMQMNTQE